MADSSYRSLLTPPDELSKRRTTKPGHQNSFKTPLYAFSLLILLVGCIAASVTILLTSHEDHVKEWKFRPSVWLSFLASVYTIALGALFFIGVAVTWWRSLAHGTTLKRLHFISAGATPKDFGAAFMAGGHARRVALAAMIVFVVEVAIGPITQRATRPKNRIVSQEVEMNVRIAEIIPDGYYGHWDHFDYPAIKMSQQTGSFGTNLTTPLDERFFCKGNGSCSGEIFGAGFNYACTQDHRTMELHSRNVNETIFKMGFNLTTTFGPPMLHIEIEYVSTVDDECIGTITTESCFLVPATVWYPIRIVDTTLSLDFDAYFSNSTVVKNYTSVGDIPPIDEEELSKPMGPLKGTFDFLETYFRSEAILAYRGKRLGWAAPDKPHLADNWIVNFADSSAKDKYPEECPIVFKRPTRYVLTYVTDYMFRSAYDASRSEDDPQNFTASYTGVELWHITNFKWLAGAVVVMIIGILAALSLFWGWWQLDRYVTLSPLETSKALGAPIFLGSEPEQEANFILREVGHERVAHDGLELVWDGTIYATGTSSQPRETSLSRKNSVRGRSGSRGHRQGMSSIDEEFDAGFQTAPPAFAHAPGRSTRRWDSSGMEMKSVGRYARQPSNSRGVAGSHEDTETLLFPLPPSTTSERGGPFISPPVQSSALQSPPTYPSPEPRAEEQYNPRFGRPRQASASPLRPLSPMYGMEPGAVIGGSAGSAMAAATSAAATGPSPPGRQGERVVDPRPRRKMSLLEEIARRAPE